ncbi:MAG: 3'(2'),5'-bisphosphate nucleotidase CysQ [Planktomarina sp.]
MLAHNANMNLLRDAALEAGKISMGYFQKNPKFWNKPGDAGPVTEGDLAVDEFLRTQLLNERPDFGWLSEETEDTPDRLSKDYVFILDPIDGTRTFIDGGKDWGVSLALAHKGRLVAAAVYMPAMDLLYSAGTGKGAWLNGRRIWASKRSDICTADFVAGQSTMDPCHWPNGFPGFKRSFRSSLAYRLCVVAQGSFDGMITFRPTWEWDSAAGIMIAQESGAVASTTTGQDITFNSPSAQHPAFMATNPMLHNTLVKSLTK